MIKTQQEQTEYLENLNFSIKDFYATSLKYEDYKDEEFKQFLKDNETEIKTFLKDLNEQIFNNVINDYKNYMRIKDLNLKSKSDIRHLKTFINDFVFEMNKTFIEENFNKDLNENEKRNFNIKFYLNFYDLINEEMKTGFKEIVEHQTEDF